ncbi:MAG: Rpp14/Pop5 family protein [Candidatus Nanohaloarchaea archaeon]|nr:Rpp14/Pop5 family protein [Candidatus Nanohaloarchaea archaeon]
MSLKNLPPSMQEKTRYLVFKIRSEQEVGLGSLVDAVWKGILEFMGELEASKADPWIMKELFDRERQVAGVRVNKDYVAEVRTALALIKSVRSDGQPRLPVQLYVVGVSGSMEKAREEYMG